MRLDPFPDRRGRVPLAVVGALLLVTSASLVAGLGARPAPTGYDAGPAVDASVTAAHAALGRAAVTASVAAAEHPVVETANTSYGRVLNADDPFREYLGLRIYLGARRALPRSAVTVGGVTATPSLPAIDSPADARAAIDRVTLAPVANATELRVRVRGVTVTATRHGGVVERANRTLTVTAATPVLAVHDRVRTFRARLDRGVLEGSGLARRVTVSLSALAEARGLAQYGGAPITNVVANRHVALLTNRGTLALERATFGAADPVGVNATRRAALLTARNDVAAAVGNAGTDALDDRLRESSAGPNGTHGLVSVPSAGPANPQPVPLAPAADDAYVAYADGNGTGSLTGALSRAYAVDLSLSVATRPADENGTLAAPGVPAGYRRVTTRRYTARRGNESDDVAVSAGVRAAAVPGFARPPASDPWLRSAAVERAVSAALPSATAALTGSYAPRATLHPTVPPTRRRAAVGAVADEHAALRNVTAHVRRRAFLDGKPLAPLEAAANASVAAASRSQGRSVAARAVAVTRRGYAERVRSLVASRRSTLAKAQGALQHALAARGIPVSPGRVTGPGAPNVTMSVSAEPAYLSLARVSGAESGTGAPTYPLAARNTNLFTLPTDDVADTVANVFVSLLPGHDATRFATAAETLRAGEAAGADRARLTAGVNDSLGRVRTRLNVTLAERTALSRAARRRALDDGFDRWGTPAGRALAVVNGSLPTAVARAAAAEGAADPALLAARLRTATRDLRASGSLTVGKDAVSAVRSRVVARAKSSVGGAASDAVQSGAETAIDRSALTLLPAGLPLLPVPGAWYVTVNAWDVAVRGGYGRFEVAAPLGRPGVADGSLRYVREDAAVSLDVDGDGRADTLGRDTALSFAFRTGVAAVVPPGERGVGDVGNADERSAGW